MTITRVSQTQLIDPLASKLDLAGGKILQIVRATDSTDRITTSETTTDVTGMAVTITPEKSDSTILVIAVFKWLPGGSTYLRTLLTDSSNNALAGAEAATFGDGTSNARGYATLVGYSTPATTSATTYKLRFFSNTGGVAVTIDNGTATGQMYAIEVSA